MSVPESAIGRNGLCPACGAEIAITREKAQAAAATGVSSAQPRRGGGLLARRNALQVSHDNGNREEAWRKFASAVDLYNGRRYAEAMTLLNALQQAYPGNPSINAAQQQCAEALKEAASPVFNYGGAQISEEVLSEDLVKGVILKKMLQGSTEEIQLQAAELAARVLGLIETAPRPEPPNAAPPATTAAEVTAPIVFPETNGGKAPAAPRRKPAHDEIP